MPSKKKPEPEAVQQRRRRRKWAVIREAWPMIRARPMADGRVTYMVDCRVQNADGVMEGKRLHFKTQDDARAEAEEKAIERRNSGTEVLRLSAAQQKEAIQAFSLIEDRGAKEGLVEMVQGYLRHIAKVEKTVSVAELVQEFNSFKGANPKRPLAKESLDDIRDCLKVFAEGRENIESFGDQEAHEVTHREISQWLQDLPVGRTTRRKYRAHLNQLFAYAVKKGYAAENPITKVDEIGSDDPPKGKLTVSQSKKLLQNSDPSIKLGIAIGLFAGLRPQSELCQLQWEDVHCKKEVVTEPSGAKRTIFGQIDVKADNRSTDRFVDIEENLFNWITQLKPKGAKGPVTKKYDRFNELLLDAATKTGIKKWPYDGLRHTYCTMHFAAFRNEGKSMANSGHRQVSTFRKHYCSALTTKEAYEYWKIVPAEKIANKK